MSTLPTSAQVVKGPRDSIIEIASLLYEAGEHPPCSAERRRLVSRAVAADPSGPMLGSASGPGQGAVAARIVETLATALPLAIAGTGATLRGPSPDDLLHHARRLVESTINLAMPLERAAPRTPPALDPTERAILAVLAGERLRAVEIKASLDASRRTSSRSLKTIRTILARLENLRLVCRPAGERGGYTATEIGVAAQDYH